MKGVIVEIHGNAAVVLQKNGEFNRVKNNNYIVGQQITIADNPRYTMRILAAACFVLILFLGTGAYAFYTPYEYVSLDVNPSLQYELNRFERVLSITPVNEDAQEIVNLLSEDAQKYNNIDTVILNTIDLLLEKKYLSNTDETNNYILISVHVNNQGKETKLTEQIKHAIETKASVRVRQEIVAVTAEQLKQAEKLKTTAGKIKIIERVAEGQEDTDIEAWINIPIKDIMKSLENYEDNPAAEENNNSESHSSDNTKSNENDSTENKGSDTSPNNSQSGDGNTSGNQQSQPAGAGGPQPTESPSKEGGRDSNSPKESASPDTQSGSGNKP